MLLGLSRARWAVARTLASPFRRYESTVRVVPAWKDVRQLALPIAFLSVKGWDKDEHGLESYEAWCHYLAKAGYTSLLLEIDPADAAASTNTSQELLGALESEVVKLLSSPGSSPFPPLLISSHLSTLLAQTYVSSHPLSGLLLHSPPASPDIASSSRPELFKTPLEEYTYEPNFSIAVMAEDEEGLKGRLLDEFGEEDDGEVAGLVGGKDGAGWKVVQGWMDANNL